MSRKTNWAGNHTYRYGRLLTPRSVAHLQEAVASSRRVRVVASRHSFNEICDSDDALIDVTALAANPAVDLDRQTVTVTAGTRFGTVARSVHDAGLALPNMGSLPHISVIGACSTGTHGSGSGNMILGASVVGLRILLADGSILALDETDTRFKGAVVALGTLGVVLEVDLRLVPTFSVHQSVQSMGNWSLVRAQADEVLASAYSVSIFTRWSDDEPTEVLLKRRVSDEDLLWHQVPTRSRSVLLGNAAHLTTRDEVVPWLDALPHFRLDHEPSFGEEIQTEYFVPTEFTGEALAAITDLAERLSPHLLVSEIRSVAADDLWLSPAYLHDMTAIHFTWRNTPSAVSTLAEEVGRRLAPYRVRPHWGKVFDTANVDYLATYERRADFERLARDLDPEGKFTSEFVERILAWSEE